MGKIRPREYADLKKDEGHLSSGVEAPATSAKPS